MAEYAAGPVGQLSDTKAARKQDLMSICACGQSADLKGYCEKCLEKLRNKHDYLVDKFENLNKEYEKFKPADIKK